MCACRLPLAPVAPGRGRLTYLCALTVSPTQGHADLLLVTFDKLGHVTFITVLPNFYVLSKLFLFIVSCWGRHFLSGAIRRAPVFLFNSRPFLFMGVLAAVHVIAPTKTIFLSQLTARSSWRQSPTARWLPAEASRTTVLYAGHKGLGARTTGCTVNKEGFTRVK